MCLILLYPSPSVSALPPLPTPIPTPRSLATTLSIPSPPPPGTLVLPFSLRQGLATLGCCPSYREGAPEQKTPPPLPFPDERRVSRRRCFGPRGAPSPRAGCPATARETAGVSAAGGRAGAAGLSDPVRARTLALRPAATLLRELGGPRNTSPRLGWARGSGVGAPGGGAAGPVHRCPSGAGRRLRLCCCCCFGGRSALNSGTTRVVSSCSGLRRPSLGLQGPCRRALLARVVFCRV